MKCQHEDILTRRFVDNNDVAMWVCAECKMRFAPASALDKAFKDGAKYEREECAELCDRFAERQMHPAECAAAIRARNL